MKDYDLGDWVTIVDHDLDIEIDAQIVEVTTTLQNNETINDITFEYGKANKTEVKDLKKLQSSIQNAENNIKYMNYVTKPNNMFLSAHPVGSIYITVDDKNPGELFGGTWVAWGEGRVPVGVNSSDSDFSAVEKTGGEKTHTLTTGEMPSHSHTGGAHAHGLNGHTHGVNITTQGGGQHSHTSRSGANFWVASSSKNIAAGTSTGREGDSNTSTVSNHTHLVKGNTGGCSTNTANAGAVDTTKTGGGQAHNNLQPYITCYMWKRTA